MNSSANVVQVPEYVTILIILFVIALVVICAVLQKKKQKKEVEEEARAKELAQLQFNQSLEQHIENFTKNSGAT